MVVPSRAVNYVLGSNKAFVVLNGVVEARDVKLGDRFEQEVEIVDGLAEGDIVATGQLARLDTGSKVDATEEKTEAPAAAPRSRETIREARSNGRASE